jgi:membrane protein implicated in regulation of membrane protease activity
VSTSNRRPVVVAIGLLLFAAALGAGATLFMQNRGEGAVQVHALGHTLTLQPYSIMVVGAVITVVALLGIAAMRRGASRARRLRRHRDRLESAFFFEELAGDQTEGPGPSPAGPPAL